jgi:hypothetical protein
LVNSAIFAGYPARRRAVKCRARDLIPSFEPQRPLMTCLKNQKYLARDSVNDAGKNLPAANKFATY